MFILPAISEIEVDIKKEQGLLSGATFLNSSGELSSTGHIEVQEEMAFANKRILLFNNLKTAVKALEDDGYPTRQPQFASQEVIDEFKRLIGNATLVLDDFKSPVQVPIISTEV
jgi:hypothetical protein